jgi:hypothetical protein
MLFLLSISSNYKFTQFDRKLGIEGYKRNRLVCQIKFDKHGNKAD